MGRNWGKGVGGWIECKYDINMYVSCKWYLMALFEEWKEGGYTVRTFVDATTYFHPAQ
jgi:hypothetical protein